MWQPPERKKHALPMASWPTKAEATASKLLSPIALGKRTARTRTWVPAMVPWRATDDGHVTQDVVDWYARFAKGRPGVIVVEATGIRDVPSGPLLRLGHDRYIDGLRRVVHAVREASEGQTLLLIQLIDFLAIRRRPPRDKYFARFLAITDDHRTALAARGHNAAQLVDDAVVRDALAAIADDALAELLTPREFDELMRGYRERVTDVNLPHIRELPQVLPNLFADAAGRAIEAGFDGIELHYAHAYTMASFLSAHNTRTDGYGGDRAGRVRLPREVAAAVRARVNAADPTAIVGARFLGDEVIAGGNNVDDAAWFGASLAEVGLDFLSVSKGGKFEDAKLPKVGQAVYPYTGQSGYECMPTIYSDERGPFGRNLHVAATVRAAVRAAGFSTPIVGAGGISDFAAAEAALVRGDCDLVGSARQSLADPDWWRKVELGLGAEVRRCEFTNYCEALDQHHAQVTCKLWDRVALDEPDVPLSTDGKRRLIAPRWR